MTPPRIEEFQKFLRGVPRARLDGILMRAFWNGKLEGTELYRAFLLETDYGVRLPTLGRRVRGRA